MVAQAWRTPIGEVLMNRAGNISLVGLDALPCQGAMFLVVFGAALFPEILAFAAPPQVPSLPAETARYVKYANDDLPAHFKNGEVAALDNTPADNLLTDAGATLGRVLFYDTRLSHDSSTSCASCHRQANGFSDPNQFSKGIGGQLTGRHSMALANGKYYINGAAFWDERAGSLEEQALIPIESPSEMGSTLGEVVTKLSQTQFYPALFQAAFGTPEVTPERIGKAVAQFERAMVSYQAKYDTAFAPGAEEPDFAAVFTADELAGEAIFHGVGRCGGCHTTHGQVGQQATNVGLDATIDRRGRRRRTVQNTVAPQRRGPRTVHARRPLLDTRGSRRVLQLRRPRQAGPRRVAPQSHAAGPYSSAGSSSWSRSSARSPTTSS